MLSHCQDNVTAYPDYTGAALPKLLFVCKTQGEECAIPRVMHQHDDRLELMFIARGSGQYLIDGRPYLAREGDLLIFNQGVLHDERPHVSPDALIYSCGISQLQIAGLAENHLIGRENSAVISVGEQAAALRGLFDTLCAQVFSQGEHHGVIAHHLLNALVVMCRNICLAQDDAQAKTDGSLGLSIKHYIDAHYQEPVSLESIMAELGITRFYLIHVFKRFSGYTPKQYLIRRRVGEAQSLLVNTEMDVTTIAGVVGYESVNNFHRVFKMVVGIPPTQYKKLWRDGTPVSR